ncbi:MAG: polysaccharide biosynthesis C-terminal domain-containing protein [Deltaproteobacteria bacterium]|nr:polysaccharide biosynthesis C-terminal domain-containing protein [Deltaproteobacteria bacterium]MBW2388524.1 polysaccharide biosynthesis C-terminal domain-containing protein [Deltaproteobacteria bacterium]MBW2724503.1 polysaccharide biosynthesis C-terminal domain-containing protein [Deltaproteobacteria bacterium]
MAAGGEEPTQRQAPRQPLGAGVLRQGAMWVTLTAALALPVSYLRNLLLGQFDNTGDVAGTFAAILILFEFVRTFVLFGGTSVVTHFTPKIQERDAKARFLFVYTAISFAAAALLLVIALVWPQAFDLVTAGHATAQDRLVISILALTFLAHQLCAFALAGLLDFRLSSVILQFRLYTMIGVLGVGYFFFPDTVRDHTLLIFAVAIGVSNILGVLIAIRRIFAEVGWPRGRYLPDRFWRFATQVHANTICAFAFSNVDQIYVLTLLGRGELGGYFLILQISLLINFVPQHIAQVLLASFSSLIAGGEQDRLRAVYLRLCRLTILLATTLSLGMIFLSRFTVGIFGDWLVDDHRYLVLLAAAGNIGCIGSVNSMLILSKEKAGVYLVNNIIVVAVQLITMILLIPDFGIYGAISGRVAGTVVGQIGLFWIVRTRIPDMRLGIPFDYWVSQILVLGSAIALLRFEFDDTLSSLAAGLAVGAIYLAAVRFKPSELRSLLGR